MARSVFRGVQIRGIAGAVPRASVNNLTDHVFCSEADRKKIVDLTGVLGYRKAPAHLCSSDLCVTAAQRLLFGLQVDPKSIDGIIFSTMTPDYRVPSTACVLQERLKCSTEVAAYDINMGCSGYVVGLYNACAVIQGGGLKRVLLLAGDTQTKLCHTGDKNVVFILGDGGTATLLEANANAEPITIELKTDGGRFQNLYVPSGGFRNPSDENSRQVRERPDGGVRSDDHLYMNGMEIFKFSSTDVVKSLASFMEAGGLSPDHISYLFLHQANKFMNDKIAGKLKFAKEKVPYSIGTYGNTGSASIPLTMAHYFSGWKMSRRHRALLCGFGVGLSWGVVDVVLEDIFTPAIVECA
ncbi:MAG: ketoacyl-ACP synthase III [Nitrospira sp.]|nr:ketoacyl-ACP synthase III [Nitrospira sp.]